VTARGHVNGSEMRRFRSSSITVRTADNAIDAEKLLPPPILARVCSDPNIGNVRQSDVYLSRIIVVLNGESPLGFAAYKPTAGPIRVAHEFWVDPHARCGLALPAEAMLTALEEAAKTVECSRLFVVMSRSTRLRRIFEDSGYTVSLPGSELTWFEKSLVDDGHPLESA